MDKSNLGQHPGQMLEIVELKQLFAGHAMRTSIYVYAHSHENYACLLSGFEVNADINGNPG
jgi:hypothetical protein